MRPDLFNRRIVHHRNLIGTTHRCEAVRDDDHRTTGHQLLQCMLDVSFSTRVKIRRRFIENQHSRVDQCGASQCDQLALTCGEPRAAFTNFGVETFREGLEPFENSE